MGKVNCPNCGEEISIDGDVCPYCGHNIKSLHKLYINKSTIFSIILLVAGVICFLFDAEVSSFLLFVLAITFSLASFFSSDGKTAVTAFLVFRIASLSFLAYCIIGFILYNGPDIYESMTKEKTNTVSIDDYPIGTKLEGSKVIAKFPTIFNNHFSIINSILDDYSELINNEEFPFVSDAIIIQDEASKEKRITVSYTHTLENNTSIKTNEEYSFETEELKKLIITITRSLPREGIIEEKILHNLTHSRALVGDPPDTEISKGLRKASIGSSEGDYLINDKNGNAAWSLKKSYITTSDGAEEIVKIEINKEN
ncbi:MAG: zinc ribbon domain-containing protein [Clostridia bacterium]|nr:zinc ribbon domain-containing protein [Clostridia bacterium]